MSQQINVLLKQLPEISTPKNQPYLTDETILENKHKTCSTFWLAYRVVHLASGQARHLITSNHCGDRSCIVCPKHRIAFVKGRLQPYFDVMKKPKHIVLTTKNMKLNRKNLAWYRNKVRSFYKVLLRSHAAFFGVSIIELKPAGNLYHIHTHIAANLSPRHDEVTKIWSRIVGYHCSTRVKYRVKKKALLNYFARRVAMAGVGLPVHDYLNYVKGSRLFSSFGKWPSYLEVLRIAETDLHKEFCFFLLCRVPKTQGETIPPPQLLDREYLEQIWCEKC